MSTHRRDPLTGFYTRAYAMAVLEDLIAYAQENVGLIALNLDVLDLFSNRDETCTDKTDADKVFLSLLVQALEDIAGEDCVIARLRGAAFWIVAPGSGANETLQLAEALREGIARLAVQFQGEMVRAPVLKSGIACFPADGQTALELTEKVKSVLWFDRVEE